MSDWTIRQDTQTFNLRRGEATRCNTSRLPNMPVAVNLLWSWVDVPSAQKENMSAMSAMIRMGIRKSTDRPM